MLSLLGLWACLPRSVPPEGLGAGTAGGADVEHVARGHYLAAVYALESGDCELALERFRQALLFDGDSGAIWRDRGRAQQACDQPAEGLESLRRAAALGDSAAHGHLLDTDGPDRAADEVLLARWVALSIPPEHLLWRGHWRVALGDLPGGVADLVAGLSIDPDDLASIEQVLLATERLRWRRTALDTLAAVHAVRPTETTVLQWWGDLAAQVGDDVTARRAYEQLDRLTGRAEPRVAHDLGLLAVRTEDPELAARVLPRLHQQFGLAAALVALIDGPEPALALLDAAQARAPLDRELALRRVRVLAGAGEVDAALAAVTAVPGLRPVDVARLQATTLAQAGRHADGLARLADHRGDQVASRLRVRLLLDLGRFEQALAESDEARRAWPDDPFLPERRVLAVEGLGRLEEAEELAAQVAARDPGRVDAALVLARLSEGSSDLEAVLEAALEREPGEPELWLELARFHWASGSQEAAVLSARRAARLWGRDSPPPQRYTRMCAEIPCAAEALEDTR